MFSAFRGLPRTAWIVSCGTVVNRVGYLIVPFLVYFLGSRGIPTRQVTFILGALGAGNLIGPIAGGLLADRAGRRQTMLAGLLGTAAAQGAVFAAPNLVTLACAAAVLSAAGTMVGPAAGALLSDTVDRARQRAAFSLVHWAVNIGAAAAGILGGFLAARGYSLLFTVDVATTLAYAVIATLLLPGERPARASRAEGGNGYGVVLKDPLMRALLPLFYVGLAIYSLTETALPLVIRDHGLPPIALGLMAALNAALVIVCQPLATRALAEFRQVPVYVAGSVLVAIGVALTGLAHDAWTYAGTVVVWSVGEAVIGGVPAATVAKLSPHHARGRYQGSFRWTWGIARFTALSLGTAVYAGIGPAALWWFSVIGGVTAALGVGALGPAIERRVAAPESPAATQGTAPASTRLTA